MLMRLDRRFVLRRLSFLQRGRGLCKNILLFLSAQTALSRRVVQRPSRLACLGMAARIPDTGDNSVGESAKAGPRGFGYHFPPNLGSQRARRPLQMRNDSFWQTFLPTDVHAKLGRSCRAR